MKKALLMLVALAACGTETPTLQQAEKASLPPYVDCEGGDTGWCMWFADGTAIELTFSESSLGSSAVRMLGAPIAAEGTRDGDDLSFRFCRDRLPEGAAIHIDLQGAGETTSATLTIGAEKLVGQLRTTPLPVALPSVAGRYAMSFTGSTETILEHDAFLYEDLLIFRYRPLMDITLMPSSATTSRVDPTEYETCLFAAGPMNELAFELRYPGLEDAVLVGTFAEDFTFATGKLYPDAEYAWDFTMKQISAFAAP